MVNSSLIVLKLKPKHRIFAFVISNFENMRLLTTFCAMLSLILTGCQQSHDNRESPSREDLIRLEQEVMKIHDETMADMENLNNYLKKIEARLADVKKIDDSLSYAQVKEKLVKADSLMWQWMYDYKKPEADADRDSVMEYLQNEKMKIATVESLMKTAMSEAEAALKKE
jgi:hypothetical protein